MRGIVVGVEHCDCVLIASPVESNIANAMMQIAALLSVPREKRVGQLVLGTVSALCNSPDGNVSAGELPSVTIDACSIRSAQLVEVVWTEGEMDWIPVALVAEHAKHRSED